MRRYMGLNQLLISMAIISIMLLVGCGTDGEVSKETQSREESSIVSEAETSIIIDMDVERPTETQIYEARKEECYELGDKFHKNGKEFERYYCPTMEYDFEKSNNDKNIKYFNYVWDHDLTYYFEGDKGGVFNIGDIAVETTLKYEYGCPAVLGNDFNKDGKYDYIIKWEGYRNWDSIIIMSDGDTYKQVDLEQDYKDISATLLDDYKMKVVSKTYGVDSEYIMANRFAYNMLNSYKMYYDIGKAAYPGYNIPITAAVTTDTNCYCELLTEAQMMNNEPCSIVTVKKMLKSESDFIGISLIYYYIFDAEGTMTTEVKMVNENWYPY